MTDLHKDAVTASSDGIRDAAALLAAMLDHDGDAQDVIMTNADPRFLVLALTGFICADPRGPEHARQVIDVWRKIAADADAGNPPEGARP
jgi:hypothetical protein